MSIQPQLFLGDNEPNEMFFTPVRNNPHFVKGHGGLWTSSHVNGTSEWIEWCQGADFWTTEKFDLYELKANRKAKVLTIDSLNDLERAFEKYGLMKLGTFAVLDFEKMSEKYDGMNLTSRGQWETRMSFPLSLYGWDVESTHWFRWVFDEVKYIGKAKVHNK